MLQSVPILLHQAFSLQLSSNMSWNSDAEGHIPTERAFQSQSEEQGRGRSKFQQVYCHENSRANCQGTFTEV